MSEQLLLYFYPIDCYSIFNYHILVNVFYMWNVYRSLQRLNIIGHWTCKLQSKHVINRHLCTPPHVILYPIPWSQRYSRPLLCWTNALCTSIPRSYLHAVQINLDSYILCILFVLHTDYSRAASRRLVSDRSAYIWFMIAETRRDECCRFLWYWRRHFNVVSRKNHTVNSFDPSFA